MNNLRKNKRGVTLVEVIVAMAIFSVMTTTFVMTVNYCIRSNKLARLRLTESNKQTTDLENYSGVVDFAAADVDQMSAGTNKYTFTFDFATGDSIVNDKNYGYVSKSADISDSPLQMRYFTSIEKTDLEADEYWITMYNFASSDQVWTITAGTDVLFFNNEKDMISSTITPGMLANGSVCKFGVKIGAGGSLSDAFKIAIDTEEETVDLTGYSDAERYAFIYGTDDGWKTEEEFDEWYEPDDGGDE